MATRTRKYRWHVGLLIAAYAVTLITAAKVIEPWWAFAITGLVIIGLYDYALGRIRRAHGYRSNDFYSFVRSYRKH